MRKMKNLERTACTLPPITELAEICIDHDHITISVDRFAELVTTEVTVYMLKRIYRAVESYNFDKVLEAMFGPRKKEENA